MHCRPDTRPNRGDDTRAGNIGIIEAICGELAELKQRRTGIKQAFNAFTRKQLAARNMAVPGISRYQPFAASDTFSQSASRSILLCAALLRYGIGFGVD